VLARENPFASCHLERLAFRFPAGVDWETLLKRMEANQWCASIVGGQGSGKTTLLEQLAPRLEERGFQPVFFRLTAEGSMRDKERLPDKIREVATAPNFILLDGAEQLSTRHWLSVRASVTKAAGFVVTVHRSSRLPVVLELETSVRLLNSLATELSGGKLPEDEAEAIFHRHRGNIRECLRELYDRWAG
jgi:GTPase SAR1 family protein